MHYKQRKEYCRVDCLKNRNEKFVFQASVYFLSPGEGGRKKPILNKYMNMIFMDTWNMFYR